MINKKNMMHDQFPEPSYDANLSLLNFLNTTHQLSSIFGDDDHNQEDDEMKNAEKSSWQAW